MADDKIPRMIRRTHEEWDRLFEEKLLPMMLESMRNPGRYKPNSIFSDTILKLLDEKRAPLRRQEIIGSAWIRINFPDDTPYPEACDMIERSLNYMLKSREEKQRVYDEAGSKVQAKEPILKEIDGFIGRVEWNFP